MGPSPLLGERPASRAATQGAGAGESQPPPAFDPQVCAWLVGAPCGVRSSARRPAQPWPWGDLREAERAWRLLSGFGTLEVFPAPSVQQNRKCVWRETLL